MVYGFVKQSGGHIKIYSEEGHGTTIKLYLPRSTETAPGAIETAAARSRSRAAASSILVVEDDRAGAQLRASRRSRASATAPCRRPMPKKRCAPSAPSLTIDLLFTDVIMPGLMNGRQLAEAARKMRTGLESAVHLGLHRKCHRSPWPARPRRAAARQAVPQGRSGADDPDGARRDRVGPQRPVLTFS